jgi:hypothetical protein
MRPGVILGRICGVIRKRCTGREAALSGKTRTPDQHSHFGKCHKKYFQKVACFSSPKNLHLTTTLKHRITTKKPQIYHQKSPQFPAPPSKSLEESAQIHLRTPPEKIFQKSPNQIRRR